MPGLMNFHLSAREEHEDLNWRFKTGLIKAISRSAPYMDIMKTRYDKNYWNHFYFLVILRDQKVDIVVCKDKVQYIYLVKLSLYQSIVICLSRIYENGWTKYSKSNARL